MTAPERYAFGEFVLERSQQRLCRRDGSTVNLTPRLFSALLLFVENAGKLLDKDGLMLALWPGVVVEENSLSQVISGLRRALVDDAPGSRYIETVPRRGFRFVAAVTVLPDLEAPMAETTAGPAGRTLMGGRRAAHKRRWLGMALAAGAATTFVGIGLWVSRRAPAAGATAQLPALAVLPFKPLVVEVRDELLELGMADSLIARLSLVPGLVVRSTGSVRRYAGIEQDPMRAARDLDVAWIVDGSLQRRGDQLRVTARLLRASDGSAAWSGSFDEKFTGVFEVQDLISARVVQAMATRLEPGLGAVAPPSSVGGTRNTEAYQLYLAACWRSQSRRGDGLRKSIELFQQAIAADPAYALAYVGLAQIHRETLLGADAMPAEVFEPANAALQRALALAPNLAEALSERGYGLYYFEFDWAGAERHFRAALAVNPNVAQAHFGLAQLLLTQDRPDEGFVHLRRARELDPMSAFYNTLEANYLLARGMRDSARIRLNRALDIAPDFYLAHRTQGLLHVADQQPERAIASLRRAVALSDGNTRTTALLGAHLARQGRHEEARAIQHQLMSLAKTRWVPPVSLATMHAALGEKAQALDALERAFAVRDTQLVFLKEDSRWADLRTEPRFLALKRMLKLDRYGQGLAPT